MIMDQFLRQYRVITGNAGTVTFDLPLRYEPITENGMIVALGCGAFGVVIKCHDKVNNELVAIKKMLNPFQNELHARRAFREFSLLRKLPQHRNIIKLKDAFATATSNDMFSGEYYLTMELMDYDLRQFWKGAQANKSTHLELSYLLYQMLCAVNHLHRLGILHRDLKPANLAVKQVGCEIRLLDFGLARCFINSKMSSYVYTRWYRAPEVILDVEYTTKADIWAIGCIFAEFILGDVYLKGENHIDQWLKVTEKLGLPNEIFLSKLQPQIRSIASKMTRSAKIIPFSDQFPDRIFPPDDDAHRNIFCANQARDLLSKILVIDPDQRLSAREALNHPYVNCWFDYNDISAPLPDFDCDAEPVECTADHWKALLWQEICMYNSAK